MGSSESLDKCELDVKPVMSESSSSISLAKRQFGPRISDQSSPLEVSSESESEFVAEIIKVKMAGIS
jgi:hypothetical protein